MKILLVTDQFYEANNGLTISIRRFAGVLRSHGHDVRILAYGVPEYLSDGETAYLMGKITVPIFDGLISSQGMTFAKPDDEVIEKAVKWADVVHITSPFILSHHVIMIAKRLGVPFTAAFHVQPENISSSIHMGKIGFINSCIYHWFHFYIYKHCRRIHCPSKFIASELEKHGYRENLYVISNGIDPDFVYRKIDKTEEFKDKFVILMIGRMSIEKRQDVLINAVAQSKYADKIQLVLAGKGPRLKQLKVLSDKVLPNKVKIQFFNKPDLMDMIAMSDLYVHSADMEIEAMSCMEAFASGLVPIIANSKKSATPQFALDERSLFKAGDPDDLAKKIDYWYEHEQERRGMEHKYAESAKKYNLEGCVSAAEEMFMAEIKDCEDITENVTAE